MLFDRTTSPIVLVRGGGDLASGAVLRLYRAGFRLVVTELPGPLVVRRMASFAQAVFDGSCNVEEVKGVLVDTAKETERVMTEGNVAVIIDPELQVLAGMDLFAVVDGRMLKAKTDGTMAAARRVIGLGPGFSVGKNCHAVVETNRGPFLGRVYWQGSAEQDTGIPESVRGFNVERVLYAPVEGILRERAAIGEIVESGAVIAEVNGMEVRAKFKGALRGLVHNGLAVKYGMKIGDLDPRCDTRLCSLASDKALSIGGGVLEAILAMYPGGEGR
jgi:xanthine dehydrogenase accessory factor